MKNKIQTYTFSISCSGNCTDAQVYVSAKNPEIPRIIHDITRGRYSRFNLTCAIKVETCHDLHYAAKQPVMKS